jgi:hypothetical protein
MPIQRSVLVSALFYLLTTVGSPARSAQLIGRMDANADIAERYQIPLTKGVPAIAVLDDQGRLLYSQKTGEFETMRHMQTGAVTDFLIRWQRPAS